VEVLRLSSGGEDVAASCFAAADFGADLLVMGRMATPT